jgi:hypothetical protein
MTMLLDINPYGEDVILSRSLLDRLCNTIDPITNRHHSGICSRLSLLHHRAAFTYSVTLLRALQIHLDSSKTVADSTFTAEMNESINDAILSFRSG